MIERAGELRALIQSTETTLIELREELARIESDHLHQWVPQLSRIEVRPSYAISAWARGSDYTPGMQVPEERIIHHRRRCSICGKIDETTRTKVVGIQTEPDFGDGQKGMDSR